ncbi:MAG: hypothetical protein KC877_04315 [Candidatus Kaiserbacteria bacterium]|nr:hypothetical protein [Candidatus Kaiserbacteria bacterium]MCB9815987.1 hypothetical protein [Candidatus Nomurabacteria bacterium]
MKVNQRTAEQYLPARMRRIMGLSRKVRRMNDQLDELGQDTVLDLIDGWSTGDPVKDFCLVACDGIFDEQVLEFNYRVIHSLGMRFPGREILVVKKAGYYDEEGFGMLRMVQLATLRKDLAEFDIDSISMRLPVEPGHFQWSEYRSGEVFMPATRTHDESWLTAGPLYSVHTLFGRVQKTTEGFEHVPDDAVCEVFLLPAEDPDWLLNEYGVSSSMIQELRRTWFRKKNGR